MQITQDDIEKALTIWGNGKITISKAFEDGGIEAARKVASANIDSYYGYNLGPVLFKPTMASGAQTFARPKPARWPISADIPKNTRSTTALRSWGGGRPKASPLRHSFKAISRCGWAG